MLILYDVLLIVGVVIFLAGLVKNSKFLITIGAFLTGGMVGFGFGTFSTIELMLRGEVF